MKHVIVLVDTSHSMINHIDKVVTGMNNFLDKLKAEHVQNLIISVVSFSTTFSYVCRGLRLDEMIPFTKNQFNRFGMTCLYDAVGSVVEEWSRETSCRHSMFIISDGDDTSSCMYSKEKVDFICSNALATGRWSITHCSIDVSKLTVVNNVQYDVDDIDGLLSGMSI